MIALFHPSMGVRPGVVDAARRLREAGHEVRVVDQYDGLTFDDYERAGTFVEQVGFPELMRRAVDGVADLPDGFIAMGFSNGGGMATHVALHRRVSGVVLVSGALPLAALGAGSWPHRVPAQVHATVDDPRRPPGSVESVLRSIAEADAEAEFVQYPGSGHLFTDASLPDEYDAGATQRFWPRVLAFCASVGGGA